MCILLDHPQNQCTTVEFRVLLYTHCNQRTQYTTKKNTKIIRKTIKQNDLEKIKEKP